MKHDWIAVAYYTEDTIYEERVDCLRDSLIALDIPFDIRGVKNRGTWLDNVNYKPTFLQQMMVKHYPKPIVYVDIDAEFRRYPILFDDLDCNIAVHKFDRTRHKKVGAVGFEILSGTIYLNNCKETYSTVQKWLERCERRPSQWDQKSLAFVIKNDYYDLPPEYCAIFDLMDDIPDPVIVHWQASREVRKNKGRIKSNKSSRILSKANCQL